ncbi:MAG: class I SAM-dependent methyltransferase, partial [Chloroflexota bacterium]
PTGSDFTLPEIFFYDATDLHFPDEQFDFVYSAVVIRFIPDKARVLEEVSRVLRPGGVAILQIGESKWDYPYGEASAEPMLTPYRTRFVLRRGQELIPLPAYLAMFNGRLCKIEFVGGARCVIKLTKLTSGQLDLQLSLNEQLTIPMSELPHGRGGIRSVYDVAAEQYQRLFDQKILTKEDLIKQEEPEEMR